LQLTPKQLFAHQTIAELADGRHHSNHPSRTRAGDWNAASNPIQQWFEQNHLTHTTGTKLSSWKCGMYATPAVGAGSAALDRTPRRTRLRCEHPAGSNF